MLDSEASVATVWRPWTLRLYESAAEAGGCLWVPARADGPARVAVPDRSGSEAARRARGQIRRYCTGNGLNRFATLTYAGEGCFDPWRLRADVAAFFKELRRRLGGEPFPYLWVPEWHPGGHGLHVHFAVGRYVGRSLIEAAWGHGFVNIKLLGDLPVGSGQLEEARACAGYLAKYAGKAIDGDRPAGLHRYEVAQGFTPESVRFSGRSFDELLVLASEGMGREPSYVWRSSVEDGWQGPPAYWIAWPS